MKTLSFILLVVAGIFSPCLAQLECNIENTQVNASDSVTMDNPFQTPAGMFQNGSGQWTWTIATQSGVRNGEGNGSTTTIGQVLRLNVDPVPNLLSANSSYIGCGVIIHGLSHSKRVEGQKDTEGRCDASLSATCRDTLVGLAEQRTRGHMFEAGQDKQPQDLCKALTDLGDGNPINSCKDDLSEHAWFEPFRK